jgi:hypothetical protein
MWAIDSDFANQDILSELPYVEVYSIDATRPCPACA